MLRTAGALKGVTIEARDGDIGSVQEIDFAQYYGYPYYWVGPYRWGELAYPGVLVPPPEPTKVDEEMLARELESGDPRLRSARDVMGYYIQATDGDLGHVEDFLIEDATWAIRYLIIDTRNWLPGRKVSWEDSKVLADLSQRHIEAGPEFDPSMPLAREHEEWLHDHLGRTKYWQREPKRPS